MSTTDESKNWCGPDAVNQAKQNGTVLDCAFKNPILGEGYCGDNTKAFCEILSGDAQDGFVLRFNNDNSTDLHVNNYKGFNCLNASEYGVSDHNSMSYDLSVDREVRCFLSRADSNGNVKGVSPTETSASATINSIIQNKGLELFNDSNGGNIGGFFNVSTEHPSPKIDNVFVHEKGFGDVISVDSGDDPTMQMISNQVRFENLDTCAMQPYSVAIIADAYTAGIPSTVTIDSAEISAGVAFTFPGAGANSVAISTTTQTAESNEDVLIV